MRPAIDGTVMPNRIIRDSCKTSPSLAGLSDLAERTFWRIVAVLDDHGRGHGSEPALMSACYPLGAPGLTLKRFSMALVELKEGDLLRFYQVDGRTYVYSPTWMKHQRVRNKESKFPDHLQEMEIGQRSGGQEGVSHLSQDRSCIYCGLNEVEAGQPMQQEHFIPIRHGGKDGDNIVSACGHCNHAKGSKLFKSLDECQRWLFDYFSKSFNPRHIRVKSFGFAAIRGESPQSAPLAAGVGVGSGNGVGKGVGVGKNQPRGAPETGVAVSLGEQFRQFYSAFPVHKDPDKAERAFRAALKRGATLVQMLAAIVAQKAEKQAMAAAGKFVSEWPYPVRWLNGGRWKDEPLNATADSQNWEPPEKRAARGDRSGLASLFAPEEKPA